MRGGGGSGADGNDGRGREPFRSVLFPGRPLSPEAREPACFRDLNLDQVVEAITAGREAYDLAPFFWQPVEDADEVRYRHEVLADVERDDVAAALERFAEAMETMRRRLAQAEKLRVALQQQRWLLDAVAGYSEAVDALAEELGGLELRSRGLRGFRELLVRHATSEAFRARERETQELREALAGIRYGVQIRGNRVRVLPYTGEADYGAEVVASFAKFEQETPKSYLVELASHPDMDTVEERVAALVAKLFPEVFGALADFCARHRDFVDPAVAAFDREIQFSLAALAFVRRLEAAGLRSCRPAMAAGSAELHAVGAFDVALAAKLAGTDARVVPNDVELRAPERILVVTGPNQGGKTTFARTVGQLLYLGALGLPVPAREATLFVPDRVFTHFEREEDPLTLRGKLEEELVRVHAILERATERSVVVMNESFTSTTAEDALVLGEAVLTQLLERGVVGVYVTFIDELSSLGEGTVSMVASVDPEDPSLRTFEVVRRPADGLAYAAAIARRYGLTYELLRERVAG